jgi:hypothetical protein
MLRSTLAILLIGLALPAQAGECSSIVASVCSAPDAEQTTGRKVLRVTPTVMPFAIGDLFPVDTHSILMDPTRYQLMPSDGSWRYYALAGVVYRVENTSGEVLEVIRNRHTSHLR